MNDAQIARNRCLAAIGETVDLETKRALWKEALRYNERMKSETGAAGLKTAGPSLARWAGGSLQGAREC